MSRAILRAAGALLAAAATTTPARAQACVAPHPSGHVASLDYGVAAMPTHRQVEAGFTYGRRITAPQWIGSGNSLLLEGGWHNGRLDVPAGVADDRASLRAFGSATVLTSLFRRLTVCAALGGGWYLANGEPAPTRFLDVPVSVGLGATLPIGGLVVLPFVVPSAAYVAEYRRATPTSPEIADNRRDLVLTYGTAIRVGRLEVRGVWRMRDQRVQQATFFRMAALVWF